MKKQIVVVFVMIVVFCLSALAYAQSTEGSKPQEQVPMEQRKAKLMSLIDQRINLLQGIKACVSAAQTTEDLRKCRDKFREESKQSLEERKEQRKNK